MTDILPVDRVFCAIDRSNLDDALFLADLLLGEVGGIKLGKEFFTANGPEGVCKVVACGHKVFLDLKYHDIPNTVAGAIRAASALQCSVLTVHASGGEAMLQAAAAAAAERGSKRPKIVAVTVLTSLGNTDLASVGQQHPVADQVRRLAQLANAAGLDGVVCSPQEVMFLRTEFGKKFLLIVPGVRPNWAPVDDQKRVMTPGQAIKAGADHLVVGRPITGAVDPVGAARRIVSDIADSTV
ncbi:MAG: orotidine-5'-phosphate decarboxylase [Pseudomonadota bacterium]|nr:orotidine-5'-phosphate decarboxylase [Pseudomonadota bacterium]